uniref:Uncharacterized protein n=1 Tax=Arundo donax TaxID=35708 RepID=A0A0A9H2A7_ARUDO
MKFLSICRTAHQKYLAIMPFSMLKWAFARNLLYPLSRQCFLLYRTFSTIA